VIIMLVGNKTDLSDKRQVGLVRCFNFVFVLVYHNNGIFTTVLAPYSP
jgi:hypothetical protein